MKALSWPNDPGRLRKIYICRRKNDINSTIARCFKKSSRVLVLARLLLALATFVQAAAWQIPYKLFLKEFGICKTSKEEQRWPSRSNYHYNLNI